MLRWLRWQLWSLLLWSHRYTAALWWHSLRAEVGQGRRPDLARLRKLVVVLYRVTSEARLANAPQLRALRIADDTVIVDADTHWHERDLLGHVLRGIDHVNAVRFADDAEPTPVAASIA
jgi:hypothetical protein